jgi:dTDP-4-amino-4,6-dideoxygalactose transaminase
MKIPFSPPHINQEIIDEVIDTLKSGWITTGPKTRLFEERLAEYCKVEKVLALNSATIGLELILRWFGVGKGDEVIVPAYTYSATANVVLHTGATPIMVDINEDDYNINIKAIKNAISPNTKVIMPVDIAGYPCDYTEIMDLVTSLEIKKQFISTFEIQQKLGRILVLSDAAHSFGANYLGNKAGKLADISVFSFHAVKNLTTAEGGAISFTLPAPFDNDDVYRFFKLFSLHGQSKDALEKTKGNGWQYDILLPGYKGNMTDIQASMGLVGLKYYDSINLKRRKEIFDFYQKTFAKKNWAILPKFKTNNKETSYHLFLLRIDGISESQRNEIMNLIDENEVSVNVHFQPLPLLTAYKNLNYKMQDYPIAYKNYSQTISLPVYQDLTDIQLEKITGTVIKCVEQVL